LEQCWNNTNIFGTLGLEKLSYGVMLKKLSYGVLGWLVGLLVALRPDDRSLCF
jgi:hypothetical protein